MTDVAQDQGEKLLEQTITHVNNVGPKAVAAMQALINEECPANSGMAALVYSIVLRTMFNDIIAVDPALQQAIDIYFENVTLDAPE